MTSKLKSTLAGLAVVALFVFGSAVLGEPLPSRADMAQAAFEDTRAEPMMAALDEAQAKARTSAESARRATLRRLHLTMPYFAVGRMLVVVGES